MLDLHILFRIPSSIHERNFPYFTMIQQFVVLLVLLGLAAGEANSPTVLTTSGTLRGKTVMVLGHKLNEFLGVPYSLPPVGELRFKVPVPFKTDAVLDVQNLKPMCFQPPHEKSVINPLLRVNQVNMSEDCLYLNIYAPPQSGEEEFPVMVWLSGEGFDYADPNQFDGSFVSSTQKVIVVSVSYRVSVFGFLNGLSQEAPGNVGLWDQRLALKWVQENIRAFGGNPGKVTLAGRFSGAMSAVIHAVSPLSKKETLFQRLILHSGIPDGKWVFNMSPLNAAMLLAENLDCVFSNFSVTISCLKRQPAEMLLKASSKMGNEWRPSVDFNLISETTLSEFLKQSDFSVDVLVGTNNNEGSLCLSILKVYNLTLYKEIVENKLSDKEYKQLINGFVLDVYKESNQLVNDLVSFTYAVNEKSSLRKRFVEFCGDLYINALSGKLEDILSAKSKKVFVYELSHRPSFSNHPSFIEAGHGDDVLYAFGLPLQMENLSQEEIQMTGTILKAIRNFLYYGNPNALGEEEWPPYSDTKLVRKFDLRPETVRSSHIHAVQFWQVLVPNMLKSCSIAVNHQPFSDSLTAERKIKESNLTPEGCSVGNWMSIQYILVGLVCTCTFLLLSLIMALAVLLRQKPPTYFQRLK